MSKTLLEATMPQCHQRVLVETSRYTEYFFGDVFSMEMLLWWSKGEKRVLGLGCSFGLGLLFFIFFPCLYFKDAELGW